MSKGVTESNLSSIPEARAEGVWRERMMEGEVEGREEREAEARGVVQ